MKKILLSACVALGFAVTAQPVISVTLTSPTPNSTIAAGTPFAFSVSINNTGTSGHLGMPTDTVIYAPLFNGNLLSNGQGGAVAWYMADPIAAGASATRSQNLNISGGASGTLEICALTITSGSSYAVDIVDTSNACSSVTYNSVGFGEFQLQETYDNSFYNNGTYFVQVSSANTLVNPMLTIVDISGRIVKSVALDANGGEVIQNVSVEDLNSGIYIVRLTTDKGLISNVKFVK